MTADRDRIGADDSVSGPIAHAFDLTGLHPRLATYFGGVPIGSVGVGVGSFEVVGTPRRWLWPGLTLLARDGIVAPVWERDVPFTVTNTPHPDGSLSAERRFEFARGSFSMHDRMLARDGALIDRLGWSGRLAAMFGAAVLDGALRMRSVEVRVRVARSWLRIPTPIAPRVELTERFDDLVGRQRVELTLEVPFIGRVYSYAGYFDYRIEAAGETRR